MNALNRALSLVKSLAFNKIGLWKDFNKTIDQVVFVMKDRVIHIGN